MNRPASLSHSTYLAKTALYERWAPEPLRSFERLAEACFRDGALSRREKELIAVGSAHVLRCPYCIDYHIGLALKAGSDKSEIAEAIWVGIAMGAGACFGHAAVAMRSLDGLSGDYYAPDTKQRSGDLAALHPTAYGAYTELHHAAFSDGALTQGLKELIAVACAHNTRCPFCIDTHVRAALDAGYERKAIAEAVWVAIEMGAGACFGHAGLAAAIMEERT